MELTLERELTARIFMHKVTMVKSAIASGYIAKKVKEGGLLLAQPYLEEEAIEYSDRVVPELVCDGKLEEVYEEAWEQIVKCMPDNYGIMLGDLQD